MAFVPILAGLAAAGGTAAAGAGLATSLAVGSAALTGISTFQQTQYQSAVAKNNAKIADQNAQRASVASQIEQMRSDREYRAQEASALAAQSASGLDVLSRSQLLSRANIARVRGEAALDIRKQGLLDTQNFFQEQANFLGEKRAANARGWTALASTAFDIGSTLTKSQPKGATSLIGGSSSKLGG